MQLQADPPHWGRPGAALGRCHAVEGGGAAVRVTAALGGILRATVQLQPDPLSWGRPDTGFAGGVYRWR